MILNSLKKSLLGVFLLSAFVFISSSIMLSDISLDGYDESFYGKYAAILHNQGIAGIRDLISAFPKEREDEAPPTPLRILFVAVGAASCSVLSTCGIENLALISFLSGIAVVLVSFLFFRKMFTPAIAFLSASLLAFSPLLLAQSGRALQDTFFTLIIIASMFFYHLLWTRKMAADSLIFGLLLLAGFLTKETMVFFYPCFVVVGLYYYRQKAHHTSLLKIISPLIITPILYFFIASTIAGGFREFFDYYLLWSKRVEQVLYVIQFQHGPWFRYLVDFTLVSPLTFLLGIIGTVIAIPDTKNASGRNIATLYLLSGLAVFSAFSVYNLRMMLFLEVFIRALAVIAVIELLNRIKNNQSRRIAAVFVCIFIIGAEISQFHRLFVVANVYDPVTVLLIQSDGFVNENLKFQLK